MEKKQKKKTKKERKENKKIDKRKKKSPKIVFKATVIDSAIYPRTLLFVQVELPTFSG